MHTLPGSTHVVRGQRDGEARHESGQEGELEYVHAQCRVDLDVEAGLRVV